MLGAETGALLGVAMSLDVDVQTIIQASGGAVLSALAWYAKRALDEAKSREAEERARREEHDKRRDAQHEATMQSVGAVSADLRDLRKDTAHQFEAVRAEMRATREVLSGRADNAVEAIGQNRQSIASLGARVGAVETEQAVAKAMSVGVRTIKDQK